jgi:hypothetical protein
MSIAILRATHLCLRGSRNIGVEVIPMCGRVTCRRVIFPTRSARIGMTPWSWPRRRESRLSQMCVACLSLSMKRIECESTCCCLACRMNYILSALGVLFLLLTWSDAFVGVSVRQQRPTVSSLHYHVCCFRHSVMVKR